MCQKLTASAEGSIGGPFWHRAQTSRWKRMIAFLRGTVIRYRRTCRTALSQRTRNVLS
jgi:hypothetical protein